jgi:hypothetical protein
MEAGTLIFTAPKRFLPRPTSLGMIQEAGRFAAGKEPLESAEYSQLNGKMENYFYGGLLLKIAFMIAICSMGTAMGQWSVSNPAEDLSFVISCQNEQLFYQS